MPEFKPHSEKQQELIFSETDLTIGATGTQWGKSQAGSIWLLRRILLEEEGSNFIVAAPTYKILNQSCLKYLKETLRPIATYNKVEAVFETKSDKRIFVRTETDQDSVVGIPNVKAYWLDEAGKLRRYFWENVQARAAVKSAKGLLTTSPYTLNWLYKDYIKPIKLGLNKAVKLIQAASWENPYHATHDPKAKKKLKQEMDPRRFNMLFGGEWGQMEGLVYDCWDDDKNLIQPITLPVGTVYYGGIDWGYTDPFVLKIRAITPDGRHYGINEFYKKGLTVQDIIEIAKQKKRVFGVKVFFCDPSQPGHIESLNRNGVTASPAENDIKQGIDIHYTLIKTGKYKEFAGSCPHSQKERDLYHYPEPKDLRPDQDHKEPTPVDQENHCMDVDRYISIMTSHFSRDDRNVRRAPADRTQESPMQRIKRLQRKKKNNRTESWS